MARAGLTRERVVLEAGELADQVGLERLTLSAVAARFGVAQPSIYKHVDNLDHLRRELAVLGLRELTAEVASAAAGRSTGEALAAVSDQYRRYAVRRPGPYEAGLRAPAADDADHLAAAAGLLQVAGAVLGGYGIEGDDLIDAIRFLRAALHGYVALEAAGGTKMPRDNDLSFRRMVSALDIAFRAWPATLTPAGSAPPPTESRRRPAGTRREHRP